MSNLVLLESLWGQLVFMKLSEEIIDELLKTLLLLIFIGNMWKYVGTSQMISINHRGHQASDKQVILTLQSNTGKAAETSFDKADV